MAKVLLYLWKPKGKDRLGHIAIKIFGLPDRETHPNGIAYISYWPAGKKGFFSSPFGKKGMLVSEEFDVGKKGFPDNQLNLDSLDLNVEAMIKEYEILKEYIEQSRWWLIAECVPSLSKIKAIETCSTTVMRVLCSGGVEKYLPLNAKFGSIRHFFLLSSTSLFISTSIFTAGLYAVVDDFNQQSDDKQTGIFFAAIGSLILNGITLLLLESKLEKKKLIEMNWPDGFIGIATSIGFTLPFLIERRFISKSILNDPVCKTLTIDIGILLSTIVSAPAFGFIANFILFLSRQTGHLNTPVNVHNELEKIKVTNQTIDKHVKQIIYKKHIAFISILLLGYLLADVTRKAGLTHEQALAVGVTAGITIGYGVLKIFFVRHWDKIIDHACTQLSEQSAKDIEAHNRSIGRYALVNMTTLLGMLSTIILYDNETDLSAPLRLILLFPGAGIGYLVGMAPFITGNAIKKCLSTNTNMPPRSITQSGERRDLLTHEVAPHETAWLFIIPIVLLSGLLFFIVQHEICSDHPAIKWISALEGFIVSFGLASGLDNKLQLSKCYHTLFQQEIRGQQPTPPEVASAPTPSDL